MFESNHAASSLLDLPPEIRVLILRYVLVWPLDWSRESVIDRAVLLTCSTLYVEGSHIMHDENILPILVSSNPDRMESSVHIEFPTRPGCNFNVSSESSQYDLCKLVLSDDELSFRFDAPLQHITLIGFRRFHVVFAASTLVEPNIVLTRRAMLHLLPMFNNKELSIICMHACAWRKVYSDHARLQWLQASIFQSLRCKLGYSDFTAYRTPRVRQNVRLLKELITSHEPVLDMLKLYCFVAGCICGIPGREIRSALVPLSSIRASKIRQCCFDELATLQSSMKDAIRGSRQREFRSLIFRCKFVMTRVFFECSASHLRRENNIEWALRGLEDNML